MCVSFILLIGEVALRNTLFPASRSVDFALMLIPFAAFSLQFARNVDLKSSNDRLYIYLRKLSVLLFLTQRIFIFGFDMLDKIFKIVTGSYMLTTVPLIHFILVAVSTTMFSMLIIHYTEKFKWLKKLY